MKKNQFNNMTTEELNIKLQELKTELFNLRFRHATGQLSNPMELVRVKKNIARVLTAIRSKEIG